MRILGPVFTPEERMAMVTHARSLLGAEWGHQKRGPKYDCVGLVWASLGAVRHIPVAPTDYGREPHNRTLKRRLTEWLGEPVGRPLEVGDVVTWRLSGEEHHVGIIGDHRHGLSFIHSYSMAAGPGGGRVIEHRVDDLERARFVEVYSP